MKLRTSLVAAATAVSMITTGISTPAFAEVTATPTTTAAAATTTPEPSETESPSTSPTATTSQTTAPAPSGSSAEFKEMSQKDQAETIKNWLGVATAVIGVLSAVFAFAAKYLPLPTAK